MGVPKFFRYISERYPCLSETIKEYQVYLTEKKNRNLCAIKAFFSSLFICPRDCFFVRIITRQLLRASAFKYLAMYTLHCRRIVSVAKNSIELFPDIV